MALFNWSDEYSVGVLAMDNHHKKLFDMVNNINDHIINGIVETTVAKMVNELVDYAKYHFAEEEKMMEQCSYSGIDSQKRAHIAFMEKVMEYKKDVDNGMAVFTIPKVSKVGVTWLKEHILVMDNKYSDTAKAAGLH